MTEIVQNNNGMKFDLLEPGNSGSGISGSEGLFNSLLGSVDTHSENDLQECNKLENVAYFPWCANGPYSPGLGSCAGVISGKLCNCRRF